MQQDRATLIYDLDTLRGTEESYPKKNSTVIQNRTVASLNRIIAYVDMYE